MQQKHKNAIKKRASCKRERGVEEEEATEKSSVYMYNVNFSRIRGLCRLFHYYFLFIFLISKETKLLCMELINCNANDSSRQIDTQKRSENNSALQKVITHTR